MRVHGKALEYRLYIDGVKIPCNSFSITSRSNEGATMMLNLLPIPAALSFKRGHLVHLFKVEGLNEPILKFFGILKNVAYTKNSNIRSVNIEVGSPDCRWEVIKLTEFSPRNVVSVSNYTLATDKDSSSKAAVDAQNKTKLQAGVQGAMYDPTVMGTFSGDAPIMTGALLPGKYLHSQSNASDGPPPDPRKVEMNSFPSVSAAVMDKITRNNNDIIRGMWEIIKQSYLNSNEYNVNEFARTKLDKSADFMLYGLEDANNLFKMDVNIDKKSTELQKQVDDINKAIAANVDIDGKGFTPKALETMKKRLADAEAKLAAFKKSSVTVQNVTNSFADIIHKLLDDSQGGGTPIKSILITLLDLIMCRMSVDPTRMYNSVIFHPITLGIMPPKCNVIFPNQYSALMYNPNLWSEPTRSAIFFKPFSTSQGQFEGSEHAVTARGNGVLCDSTDPVIIKIRESINTQLSTKVALDSTDSSATAVSDSINNFASLGKLMTEEETWKGVLLNVQTKGLGAFSALDDEPRLIIANFLHNLSKYGVRLCGVQGELLDDLITGMPILILDGEFTIHGILDSFNYSVDQNGSVMSDLTISCPRFAFYEKCPRMLMWLDGGKFNPDKIGDVYSKSFGCDSIYSKEIQSKFSSQANTAKDNPDNLDDVLIACINDLFRQYYKSTDTRQFVDIYRRRTQITEDTVFSEYHQAKPIKASGRDNSTVMWQGADFAPKTYPTIAGVTHPEVDKQALARHFLEDYYGRPGRVE